MRHELSPMFTVLATENPIEYEGTYPLPEAQLDRFLLKILLTYPSEEHERRWWRVGTTASIRDDSIRVDIQPLPDADAILRCRAEIARARMEPGVQRYVVDLVRRTRAHPFIHYGASPRASVALLLCSKALSAIRGRDFVTPDDVRDVARPVLRHRLTLRAEAELDGATPDSVITDILKAAEVRTSIRCRFSLLRFVLLWLIDAIVLSQNSSTFLSRLSLYRYRGTGRGCAGSHSSITFALSWVY